jgi:hypothetical protein
MGLPIIWGGLEKIEQAAFLGGEEQGERGGRWASAGNVGHTTTPWNAGCTITRKISVQRTELCERGYCWRVRAAREERFRLQEARDTRSRHSKQASTIDRIFTGIELPGVMTILSHELAVLTDHQDWRCAAHYWLVLWYKEILQYFSLCSPTSCCCCFEFAAANF